MKDTAISWAPHSQFWVGCHLTRFHAVCGSSRWNLCLSRAPTFRSTTSGGLQAVGRAPRPTGNDACNSGGPTRCTGGARTWAFRSRSSSHQTFIPNAVAVGPDGIEYDMRQPQLLEEWRRNQ
jgi:hypothetical protein